MRLSVSAMAPRAIGGLLILTALVLIGLVGGFWRAPETPRPGTWYLDRGRINGDSTLLRQAFSGCYKSADWLCAVEALTLESESNPDAAETLLQQAWDIATTQNSALLQGIAADGLARYYLNQGNTPNMLKAADRAEKLLIQANAPHRAAHLWATIGTSTTSDATTRITAWLRAIDHYGPLNDKNGLAQAFTRLGDLYSTRDTRTMNNAQAFPNLDAPSNIQDRLRAFAAYQQARSLAQALRDTALITYIDQQQNRLGLFTHQEPQTHH